MSTPPKRRARRVGFVAGTAVALASAALAAWHWLSMPGAQATADAPDRVAVGEASGPASGNVAGEPSRPGGENDQSTLQQQAADAAAQWETVERLCTWPPEPSAWSVLDEACLEAMDAIEMNAEWRTVMNDPAGTRWAVAVALDDVRCHVPPGESRPDLREACAADAMVRLAKLQRKCMVWAHMDWGKFTRSSRERMRTHIRERRGRSRQDEDVYRRWGSMLWRIHRCRSAIDALEWLDAVPRPPGNLANAGLNVYDPEFIHADDDGEQQDVSFDTPPPRLTQDVDLFALARRLGAKLPGWADRMLDVHGPAEEHPGTNPTATNTSERKPD